MWAGPAIWFVCLALSLAFQRQSGAWESDFGGHADEGAHVVTGLMVRDFLAGGFREDGNPLAYAKAYYERFPKVALGHYPPGFYLLEGLWLLPWRGPGAVLALMAALAAGGGWLTWRTARQCGVGGGGAAAMAGAFCLLPLVRTYAAIVMSDLLLVILVGLAARAFVRLAETGRARHGWAFGGWAAAAILTKGSGLLLALVPPLTILFTGRWDLGRRAALWFGMVPVLVVALPWMLATRHITAEGMSGGPWTAYVTGAARFYPLGMARELGWILSALLAAGGIGWLWRRFARRARPAGDPAPAVWGALIVGLLLFYAVMPSGMDTRYLLPLVPAALGLGGGLLTSLVGGRRPAPLSRALPGVALALVVLVEALRPVEKRFGGATEAIHRVLRASEQDEANGRIPILGVAGAAGEGALTAAAAFEGRDRLQLLRGSKVLASSDWLGRGYASKVADPAALKAILQERAVAWILLEEPPGGAAAPDLSDHQRRLLEWLRDGSLPGEPVFRLDSPRKRGQTGALYGLRVGAGPVPGGEAETAESGPDPEPSSRN